jgi:hypothetical protein
MYRVLSFRTVLIVEDKGDFCERVGVVHIYFNTDRYKVVEDVNAAFCVDKDGSEEAGFGQFYTEWMGEFEGAVRG